MHEALKRFELDKRCQPGFRNGYKDKHIAELTIVGRISVSLSKKLGYQIKSTYAVAVPWMLVTRIRLSVSGLAMPSKAIVL